MTRRSCWLLVMACPEEVPNSPHLEDLHQALSLFSLGVKCLCAWAADWPLLFYDLAEMFPSISGNSGFLLRSAA